ncbi:MAG: ATP-dependent DNA helicase [Myxococcota bacterium]|nr:ATP-dependent DNA helicase [Myxococcota bacterium]MDW8361452.1 ATP-dependent DNA helicase [Myxococcales bacterium]
MPSATEWLGPDGPLARATPGWELRPSQLEMAAIVERTLREGGIAIVEAGTGTGKTLAYLVPALLSGRRVVVSTATRALQDQIVERDVPALLARTGLRARVVSLKGLPNYVCLRRLEETRAARASLSPTLADQLEHVERWLRTTRRGERAELASLPEEAPIWAEITSSSDSRIGPRCPYYEECFATRARSAAERADLVVVNHHLFFADRVTRTPHGGGVLPDHDAVVFDEAHALAEIATAYFGTRVSAGRFDALVRDARRAAEAAGVERELGSHPRDVERRASALFDALPVADGEPTRRALDPDALRGAIRPRWLELDAALDALGAAALRHAGRSEALAHIARRATALREQLATLFEPSDSDADHVTWIEREGRRPALGASPVDVGALLREHVWTTIPAVVLTSATLAVRGRLDFSLRRLGLDAPQLSVHGAVLPSPFDFARQVALYLPTHLPEPDEEGFLEAAAAEIDALVGLVGGGAFVLCTSIRAMHALFERAPQGPTVLVQGQAPRAALLERFRADGNAVLYATASFWEGVDVPGDALRLVVIDRLPFDVPTDPLVAARARWIRANGGDPFRDEALPAAALALEQAFGRLVRATSDHGIVAVLDRRIVTRGYGRVFLETLPPATRCDDRDAVSRFWRGLRAMREAREAPLGPSTLAR